MSGYNEFNIKIDIDKFNNRQHFIIVVNGIDIDTIEVIKYWRSIGLDCDAIVYYLYDINNKYFIEFKMYSNIDDYCFNNSNNFYILNTNFSNNPSCHNSMLDNKKAAAYYSPWKDKIKYLNRCDTVFLYKSKAGIVAYGKADGIVNKIDYENKHEA